MKSKVLIITAKDEFELVKKFNEDKREFFASQPVQKNDGSWVMFCYYNSENNQQEEKNKNSKKLLPSKPSSLPATKSQLDYIYKNDLDVDTENLTKKDAWKIINEHKKKNNGKQNKRKI